MRRVLIFGAVLAALAWTVWTLLATPGNGPPAAGRSELDRSGALPVLRVRGDARAKGRAHGRACAESIRRGLERLGPEDEGVREFAIERCGVQLAPALPRELREEIEGIAEGAGITFHEALFLNTRFELAAFGLVGGGAPAPDGAGAVGPGPRVARVLDAADALVIVHEDLDPPLVLVALPGMAGGFLGVRGEAAAAICPSGTTPTLNGLVFVLMLRRILETEPRDELPGKATGAASIAMRRSGGEAGSLNLSPAGAAWFPGGAFSATTSEAPGDSGRRILAGSRSAAEREECEARARRLLAGEAPAGASVVMLEGRGAELKAIVVVAGERRETAVFPPR